MAGLVGIPIFEGANRFGDFLAPVFKPAKMILEHGADHAGHHSIAGELILMGVSLAIAIAGWLFARRLYVTDPPAADRMVERFKPLHTLVYNKYWIDELYDVLFVNSIVNFSRFLWRAFDEKVIDGIVNGVAELVRGWAKELRQVETGLVKDYALAMLMGVVVVIGYFVLK